MFSVLHNGFISHDAFRPGFSADPRHQWNRFVVLRRLDYPFAWGADSPFGFHLVLELVTGESFNEITLRNCLLYVAVLAVIVLRIVL
jgi:hypothetical protein